MELLGDTAVDDLGAALLEAAAANLVARRAAGAEQLRIAFDWALTHRRTRYEHLDEETRAERDIKRIGASSYPVYEYAAAELAAVWEMHPLAAQSLMGDAVDLERRHPHTWTAVQQGRLDAWVARKISSKTRELDLEQARAVDEQIADKLGTLPTGRLLTLVDARVVAADRAAAEEKWAQAASERIVHAGRETEHGTRNLFARMDAAGVMRLMATITMVAGQLPPVDGETQGQRMARALALLADPQAALELLAGRDPRGGKAVVYVHTTPDQLARGGGVARVEDLGPYTRTMLQDLLRGAQVTLKPVIDLNDRPAADSYEIPADIAERLHLTKPAEVYPWAAGLSRHLDKDHTTPYDEHGPPGQTSVAGLGKLNRRHHRIKTHAAGWTVTRLSGHRYWWTSPSGRGYLVDRQGTHPLPRMDIVLPSTA